MTSTGFPGFSVNHQRWRQIEEAVRFGWALSHGSFHKNGPWSFSRRLRAREVRPEVKGILVGDGELRRELEQWVADHQMQDAVEFWGFREDLPRVFQELDLFAMSSDREALPLTLLIAAATGLPFACTAVGGIPEVFQDGVHGRLVPPDNPVELADAVVWSIDNYATACAMAKTASALVHERHGLAALIGAHETLYRQLVRA